MKYSAIIFDLDGTVYIGSKAVPGIQQFVNSIVEKNIKPIFLTNRANRTAEEISNHLNALGIKSHPENIVTSAHATADYIKKGSTVYCIGESGLVEAIMQKGIKITEESPDYVVVSFDRYFNYKKLETACKLINSGSIFIATNIDPVLKIENGFIPGTGAIVAAISAVCKKEPVVIGKPERYIIDYTIKKYSLLPEKTIIIGDNLDTDILAANRTKIKSVLIFTGVSSAEELKTSRAKPDYIISGYNELYRIIDI